MVKNKNWYKWILGLVIFVCFVQFVRMLKVPRIRENVKSSALIVENAEVTPVDFWIRGREKIHVGSHAEVVIPWLAWLSKGTYYRLTGHIKYDGHKARINFKEDTKPVLMFKSNEYYYLVVQHYFSTAYNYIYRRGPKESHFAEIQFASLPEELTNIEFTHHELGRLFRISYLTSLLEEKGVQAAVAKFGQYVKANPRTFYCKNWRGKQKKGFRRKAEDNRLAVIDFLQKITELAVRANRSNEDYWSILAAMLKSAGASDDPQEIRLICAQMFHIDREESLNVIKEFFDRARKENIPDDSRLYSEEFILTWWTRP